MSEAALWRYSINYGPDGEENWANLITPDGRHVANIRTHDAHAIVAGMNATSHAREASAGVGRWLSAALDDPGVCAEMKADINAWFAAGEPAYAGAGEIATPDDVLAQAWDFVRPKLVPLNNEKGPAGVWSNGFRSGWSAASRSRAALSTPESK